MKQNRTALAIVAALVLIFSGCADTTTTPAPNAASPPSASAGGGPSGASSTDAAPTKPSLNVIDEKGFAELLQQHRGQVVLVDFWATWCVECLKLMPHTVELGKEFADQGLHVVLISLDSPEDQRERAEALLAKNGVTFETYMSRYGGDPKSAETFEIENAALPNIKLYDRKGVLRKVFSAGRMPPEPFDAEDIEKAVRELLAEK